MKIIVSKIIGKPKDEFCNSLIILQQITKQYIMGKIHLYIISIISFILGYFFK